MINAAGIALDAECPMRLLSDLKIVAEIAFDLQHQQGHTQTQARCSPVVVRSRPWNFGDDVGTRLMTPSILSWLLGVAMLLMSCDSKEATVEKAVLFSAVEGRVLKGGRPLAGATLIRDWVFAEDDVIGQDKTVTDAEGQFQLPQIVHIYSPSRWIRQQPRVDQTIHVVGGGRDVEVWSAMKLDFKPGTEAVTGPIADKTSDSPLRVVIDLDSPVRLHGQVFGQTLFVAAP